MGDGTFEEADQKKLKRINAYLLEGRDLDEIAELVGHKSKSDLELWLKYYAVKTDDNPYVPKPERLSGGSADLVQEGSTDSDSNSALIDSTPDSTDEAEAVPADVGEPASSPTPADITVPIDQIIVRQRFRKRIEGIEALAESIDELGLLQPPVVTPDYQLVCGHRRIEAFRLLGWTHAPVRVMDIRDVLRGEADENIQRQNFTPSELVAIAEAMREQIETDATSRRLGKLRNVNKDIVPAICRNEESGLCGETNEVLAKLVGTSRRTLEKAREIVLAAQDNPDHCDLLEKMDDSGKVDGPWNELKKRQRNPKLATASPGQSSHPKISVVTSEPGKWFEQHGDEFDCLITEIPSMSGKLTSEAEYLDFTESWLKLALRCLNDNGVAFLFAAPGYPREIDDILQKLGSAVRSRIIWQHPNLVRDRDMTDRLPVSYEVILHLGDGELQANGSRRDVWKLNVPNTDYTDAASQRIEKPLELIKWLVELGTKPGGKVLDCFAYSGYTGLACAELGRECVMIERDAKMVDVMRARVKTSDETPQATSPGLSSDYATSEIAA